MARWAPGPLLLPLRQVLECRLDAPLGGLPQKGTAGGGGGGRALLTWHRGLNSVPLKFMSLQNLRMGPYLDTESLQMSLAKLA